MKIKLEELKLQSFVTGEKKKIEGGVCSLGSGCNFTRPYCSQVPDLCFT